jgi:hypothetical protein
MKLKIVILSLLLCITYNVQAQSNLPLVIHIEGYLNAWTGGDRAPEFTGCNTGGFRIRLEDYSLVLSSQGDWAAFMALPQDMLIGSAPSPTGNLWVCNLKTGDVYALTEVDPGIPNMASEGAFSPDGNHIVWSEVYEDFSYPAKAHLMIHDLTTKETRILVESIPLTDYCGIGTGATRVIWGEAGIVVGYGITADSDPCSGVVEYGFSHFDEAGTLLNSFPVDNRYFNVFEWLAGDEPRIAFMGLLPDTRQTQMYSLDMTTGGVEAEDAALEAFIPGADANTGHYLLNDAYYVHNPPLIYIPGSDDPLEMETDVALSPDGEQMAIMIGHTLYLAENGHINPASWNTSFYPLAARANEEDGLAVPNPVYGQFEVAWANPAYQLVPIPESVCPGVEKLEVEAVASVVEGLGDNNLRDAPYPNADILNAIPEGRSMDVIDIYNFSPFNREDVQVCSGGIRWREVIFERQNGWTAESEGDVYYMEVGGAG